MDRRTRDLFLNRVGQAASAGELNAVGDDLVPFGDDPDVFVIGEAIAHHEMALKYGWPSERELSKAVREQHVLNGDERPPSSGVWTESAIGEMLAEVRRHSTVDPIRGTTKA